MKTNDRMRAYAKQRNVDSVGHFKSNTTKRVLSDKLTPKQRKRLRLKGATI